MEMEEQLNRNKNVGRLFKDWEKLFTDSVSVNKKYLTDTLYVNKKYLTDSVFPIEKKTC